MTISLVSKRLASVPSELRETFEALLARLPSSDLDDHLEAFEMQEKRMLGKDTLAAFQRYVKVNGSEDRISNRQSLEGTVESFKSSFEAIEKHAISADKIIKSFGDQLPREYGLMADKRNFQVQVNNCVHGLYRSMDFSVGKKAEALAQRTEYLGALMMETLLHGSDTEIVAGRLGGLGGGSAVAQAVVGRVCSETEEEGTMNLQSILLEGDISHSLGRRAKFYVTDCKEDFALCPGAVVGAIGRTLRGGDEFFASSVESGLSIPNEPSSVVGAVEARGKYAESAVQVTVAFGPFSTRESLNFNLFTDLSVFVKDYKPHVVVLGGPFLDISHPKVSSGSIFNQKGEPVSFEDIYKNEIIPRLEALAKVCQTTETQLIIMPSLTDTCGADTPLPQPAFEWRIGELGAPHVHFASNPCSLSINGDINLMLTTSDILKQITSELVLSNSLTSKGANRIDLAIDLLLKQRTLFPSAPCALPIEPSLLGSLSFREIPEILCFPSVLTQFAKNVEGRFVINAGSTCKGSGGGSVANIFIFPENKEKGRTGIQARIKAEILKVC